MRIVFVGRQNFTNHCFANWLSQRHQVVAYFRADMERHQPGYQWKWLQKRIKRKGIIRAIDEFLFQLYYNVYQTRMDYQLMLESFSAYFGAESFVAPKGVPYYEFPSLNAPEAIEKLRELQPDLVFAVCISEYLKKPYREIPKYGSVLYHEGLTPEYRGLHTAFWANVNGEGDKIGYTLLRVNEKIDGGTPIAQGIGRIYPRLQKRWVYAGHKALIDGLPDVERALAMIEREEPIPPIQREFGAPGMYSYAGLSDELRRIRVARRRVHPPVATVPKPQPENASV
ncbi:MAG: hypothetical protein CUN53_06390 [Phototrophicales bacterium]|nr:MAG: hypothetical protein CUN53_06390 [Phototrophicales bacterium]